MNTLLIVFQFSGHVVIPSLATDMADPSQFDKMINWAFVSLRIPRILSDNRKTLAS